MPKPCPNYIIYKGELMHEWETTYLDAPVDKLVCPHCGLEWRPGENPPPQR